MTAFSATLSFSMTPQMLRNRPVAAGAALLLAVGALLLAQVYGWRQGALYLVGGALGLTLYHAMFGFTGAWRVFIADRRGAGLRAQMLLLAVAVTLFFPALAAGTLFGQPVGGFVAPAGMSVLIGAFVFGIGMQLGGGCASGTLFTVGGGSVRMLLVLFFFVIGSVLATAHLHWWFALPALPPLSLVHTLGLWPALGLHWLVFAVIAVIAWIIERRHYGGPAPLPEQASIPLRRRLLRGPWPLVWAALALALLNFATLALAGRPWGVTSAFALWGAKLFMAVGIDVTAWPHWAGRAAEIQASVFGDVTSVMNFGIILGAMLAAALAGKFAPVWRLPLLGIVSAVVGGLLLGYGARLSFGCNIGAFFSGIASSSLHGWLWLIAAFAGNVLGTRLRPYFGLEVERTARSGC